MVTFCCLLFAFLALGAYSELDPDATWDVNLAYAAIGLGAIGGLAALVARAWG